MSSSTTYRFLLLIFFSFYLQIPVFSLRPQNLCIMSYPSKKFDAHAGPDHEGGPTSRSGNGSNSSSSRTITRPGSSETSYHGERLSSSSHTVGRSQSDSSSPASSHTLGQSTTSPSSLDSDASSHTLGSYNELSASYQASHTIGRSDQGSENSLNSSTSSQTLGHSSSYEEESKSEDADSGDDDGESEDEGDLFAQSYRDGSKCTK
jgi:hypothetical protein